MKILVINGPNLNFLGIREKAIYGNQDYNYLLKLLEEKGKETGSRVTVFQSNHEGAIIDRLQEAYFDGTEGIVINPGAFTHYSYAIRDALSSITVPKVEIHISDITKREEFRKISVTAPACDKQIYGQGLDGYLQAIDFILAGRQAQRAVIGNPEFGEKQIL
nr:type II 3-dehydroquinate dehydratase [uncultured Eisenbergiella sp.]